MSKYIFLILASFFLLSACTGNNETLSEKNNPNGYIQELKNASAEITSTKEFESCVKPSIAMCLTQVANQLSREGKSTHLCDELADEASRDACKFWVISTQAIDMNTIGLCDNLGEIYKRECRINIFQSEAIKSSNIEECDVISWEYSFSWSQNIQWSNRIDQCKLNILTRKSSLNNQDCNLLKDISMRKICQSTIRSEDK